MNYTNIFAHNIGSGLHDIAASIPGYRARIPGFGWLPYQVFWEVVFLERGLLALLRIIEDTFAWKVATPV
jgi:hypothetical protein